MPCLLEFTRQTPQACRNGRGCTHHVGCRDIRMAIPLRSSLSRALMTLFRRTLTRAARMYGSDA